MIRTNTKNAHRGERATRLLLVAHDINKMADAFDAMGRQMRDPDAGKRDDDSKEPPDVSAAAAGSSHVDDDFVSSNNNAEKKEQPCCSWCHRTGRKMYACGGCQKASYCGKQCQAEAWPSHRQLCRESRLNLSRT